MNKIVYKSKIIRAIIIMIATLLIITIYPLRWWDETVTSSIPGHADQATGPVNDVQTLTQNFFAQYDHMGSIRIYLHSETTGESFYFRLLDPAKQVMFEETVMIDPDRLPGYVEIMVDMDMKVNEQYSFVIQGKYPEAEPDAAGEAGAGESSVAMAVSELYVGREWVSQNDYPFLGLMYHGNDQVPGWHTVADYKYDIPFRKGMIAIADLLVLIVAGGLLFLVGFYYRKYPERNQLLTIERAVKKWGNPLVAIGVVVGLGAVLFKVFGNYALDNTFFFISIILLGGILFYGINHNRDGLPSLMTMERLKEKWPDYLQSVMFAGVIAACCEYMYGLYDIHHRVAERKEVIFFCLALLVMMKRKELFNVANLVYSILAGGYGYYFYTTRVNEQMDQLNRLNLQLTVWATVLIGLVVINVLMNVANRLLKREMKPLSWRYGGFIVLFFMLAIFFRNERWWIVAMAVAFVLYYLQYGAWRKWDIMTNICRGIAMQFIWATGYALLYRPFVTFRTVRYPHIFHTVTITATYLTVVECVALVMLLNKLRTSCRLRDFWKEAVFFGVVTSYMLFTMARTGFVAVAVIAIFAVIIMTVGRSRRWFSNILSTAGIMILATVVCFPVTFFVQRTVPALVSEPRLFDIESYPDEVMRGRQLDSREFMLVGRFIEVFADKIFNIPEGTLDLYGEIAAYDADHYVVIGTVMDAKTAEEWGFVPEKTVAEQKALDAQNDSEDKGWSRGEAVEPISDYTNGRTDIYRAYLDQLNTTGHKEMGALLPDGSRAVHAHNIYLQFAYDHGLFMGILFVALILISFVKGLLYFFQYRDQGGYAALPVVVILAVAVAGMVEWTFHFSNPSGFVLLLMLAPLMFDRPRQMPESL